ncbi:MAG: DoxX family protein [Thermomicrobiales bacterium]|nr:DoxX family protein [Thermomicrobiales bacterium]
MNRPGVNLTAPWGIALLRVMTGIIFLMHGQQKLFEFGLGGVAGMMTGLGVPAPGLMAIVLTLVELIGGIALILGAFTRLAAALVAVDVLVAMFLVHLPNGFFAQNGGVELVLLLATAAVTLLLTGPGAMAVDSLLPVERRLQSAPLASAPR